MILTELKKTYVILTGPLYSGKSTAKELLKRQQTVDKFSTLKGAKQELKWYSDVAKQLDAKVLK